MTPINFIQTIVYYKKNKINIVTSLNYNPMLAQILVLFPYLTLETLSVSLLFLFLI